MKRKILIVEDYDDSRIFMKYLLESFGYQVIEAADGLEALSAITKDFPDLILMDMAMPNMDGLAATKAIRKFKHGADVPIIAVTAFGVKFYERAIEAGCNDLIEKPVDFDSLEAVLGQYLEH